MVIIYTRYSRSLSHDQPNVRNALLRWGILGLFTMAEDFHHLRVKTATPKRRKRNRNAITGEMAKKRSVSRVFDAPYDELMHVINDPVRNAALEDINLAYSGIDDAQLRTVCEVVTRHRLHAIVILDLSFNRLVNIDPLINILSHYDNNNKTDKFTLPLESLILWRNSIDKGAIRRLARVLETNTTLTKLNLAENNVGNDGAAILAEALAQNQSLETLELFGNNISSLGASKLCDLLEKFNASILLMDLRFNMITCRLRL